MLLVELIAPVRGNEEAIRLHRALFWLSLVNIKKIELVPQETEVQILQS